MNTSQKIIKYFAIVLATLVVVYGVSRIIMVVGFIAGPKSFEKLDSSYKEIKIVQDNFKELDISLKTTNLTIKYGEKLKIQTNNENLIINDDDNILKITEEKGRWFHFSKRKNLVIFVPNTIELNNLTIRQMVGEISLEEIVTKKFEVYLGTGKTIINKLIVQESALLTGGVGSIEINSSHLNNLNAELGVGTFSFNGTLSDKLNNIDCGVGSVYISLMDAKENYLIKYEKGIGSIIIDNESMQSQKSTIGSGETVIDIDGGIGKIDIKFD